MVAIPVGFDQPGVAARIQYHRVGESLNLGELTSERLTPLIRNVLEGSIYHDNARRLQKEIQEARGLDAAADVIERAFRDINTAANHTNYVESAYTAIGSYFLTRDRPDGPEIAGRPFL